MDPLQLAAFIQRHGETVTISRDGVSPDASVKAKVRQGVPEDFVGDKHVARHTLTIAAADAGWGSWPVPPVAGDRITFDGRPHLVDGVRAPKLGEDRALYALTIIG